MFSSSSSQPTMASGSCSWKKCTVVPSRAISDMRKTIEALQQRVWWPGMAQDIRHFIAGCLPCLQSKDQTSFPPGSLAPIPLPFDHFSFWTMDFIKSLPEDQGCNTIFTCIDKLTKLVRLTPCHMGEGLLSAE